MRLWKRLKANVRISTAASWPSIDDPFVYSARGGLPCVLGFSYRAELSGDARNIQEKNGILLQLNIPASPQHR